MAVGKRDIEIIKSDDYSHVVRLSVRVGADVVPVDITGRTYTATLSKTASQTVPTASFVCVVTDAENGEITISMSHVTTSGLVTDCYVWKLEQDASGVLNKILGGKANVILG